MRAASRARLNMALDVINFRNVKPLWLWFEALWRWLAEPTHFWIAIAVAGIALLISFRTGTSEPVIRLTGLALQLLGVGTVAWGIGETRRLFGRPTLLTASLRWLRRFPSLRPQVITGTGSSGSAGGTASGRGYVSYSAGANATVQARVEVLERNLQLTSERVDQTQRELELQGQKASAAIEHEEGTRAAEDQEIRSKLEVAETGGLHVTAMGALWLLVGVTLSTASPELAKWLQ